MLEVMDCPRCGTRHVDKGKWATFDHKKHLCAHCGEMFERPTAGIGVATVEETQHHCHAPGCEVAVPPKMFMCKRHWFALPREMRDRIWATYVPGQERREVSPTPEYLEVAERAQRFIAEMEKPRGRQMVF